MQQLGRCTRRALLVDRQSSLLSTLPADLLPSEKKLRRHTKDFTYLTEAQLVSELDRCLQCATKPCEKGCPVNCSPADFIYAARDGLRSGGEQRIQEHALRRSAAEIMKMNPIGGVCGVVCPDTFCMKACAREALDKPIDIPAVQAAVMHHARQRGVAPTDGWRTGSGTGRLSVAVVGAGPAGLAATAVLARSGDVGSVVVFDKRPTAGGSLRVIPESRLPTAMVDEDVQHIGDISDGKVQWRLGEAVDDVQQLAGRYDAVVLATGLTQPRRMGIANEQRFAHAAVPFLWTVKTDRERARQLVAGKRVAVVGGGAVAVDVATTCVELGAAPGGVSLLYRRGTAEMPVTEKERQRLLDYGVDTVPRQVPLRFLDTGKLVTRRQHLPYKQARLHDPHRPAAAPVDTASSSDDQSLETVWSDVDVVISAIGDDAEWPHSEPQRPPNVYVAGDVVNGASTAVQAAAYGKNVAEQLLLELLPDGAVTARPRPAGTPATKSYVPVAGYDDHPADVSVDFFGGLRLTNPFLLSASPMSDGFEQVDEALRRGWGGAFLKTTFDDVHFPVHVPNRYMERFDGSGTYGNCDNVSDHPMSRVAKEVRELAAKWRGRGVLIGASTGGDVSGKHEHDRQSWQSNTRALEDAGAMAIEYSLSCPQGGEGAEASQIVSQSADMSARVVDYVLSGARLPHVPKLFKLTAAVASTRPVVAAIAAVAARYPHARVGITLANSFPVMAFRDDYDPAARRWPYGVVLGMAGAGVLPITYKTLSETVDAFPDLYISANGGVMDAEAAANVLALGCRSVQMCTLPTRDGYACIDHLTSGLAHLLARRRLRSVDQLIGVARWPHHTAVRGFMELPPKSQISTLVHPDTCISCGNCTRCPYGAIELDPTNHRPVIDPSRCVGCSMCVLKCPSQSLELADRLN